MAEIYFTVRENDRYGLINADGVTILENVYKKINLLDREKNLYRLLKQDNTFSVVDLKNNKEIITFKGDNVIRISNNYIYVYFINKKLTQIYDMEGNELFKDNIKILHGIPKTTWKDKLLNVSSTLKYGIINSNKKEIIPLEYDSVDFIGKDYFLLKKGGESYITNLNTVYIAPKISYIKCLLVILQITIIVLLVTILRKGGI